MNSDTYRDPYDPATYSVEPTDADAIVLARALAHWCHAYQGVRTVREIIEDILMSNGASDPQMVRDECIRIARATDSRC